MTQPILYMIAGPNGSGKTTAAMKLLPDFLSVHEFVNADEIARGLNPLDPDGQSMDAGRLMLRRINDLIDTRKSFAFETTGASHVFTKMIKQAKNAGYITRLIYLWLPDVEYAKRRVQKRVAEGGHNIAENVIERRYNRGLYNLINLYLPLVDWAVILDNSTSIEDMDNKIAAKFDGTVGVFKQDVWQRIRQEAKESGHE